MTRDEIIRMAIQCQLGTTANRDGMYMEALHKFAALVAEAERASLVDSEPEPVGQIMYANGKLYTVTIFDHALASDIPVMPIYARPPTRARGEK